MVYNAARPPGTMREPSVSVPIDTGAKPAETATAEPEEDPEGFYNGLIPTRGKIS